ncbi:hypothetical protein [Deinococcus depolymerans]|uniref:Lipoprotein n=1 Tax=Deinococcus depolymerans TaxID=392408 RepID=A0ABP3M4A4_9DEIO
MPQRSVFRPSAPRPTSGLPFPRPAALLLTALLGACTGTEEVSAPLTLAVLSDGGAVLRTVTPTDTNGTVTAPERARVTVAGGVSLATPAGGRRLLLTRRDGVESRAPDLNDPRPYPDPAFTPRCDLRSAQNAARDRLLILSDCGGVQNLALYQNATPVWTAALPTALVTTPAPDAPPTRLAVQGDVAVVTRPRLGGGSEVLRAAPVTAGDPVAQVSLPQAAPAIRDLANLGGTLIAATDTGVQSLTPAGLPDPTTTRAALGAVRFDRLWTGGALLAAWRDPALAGTGSEPLRLWDGRATTAATVENVSDLRDLTVTPDGFLYTLTGSALRRHDTLLGLQNGNWRSVTLPVALNDARSVSWIAPTP